MKETVPAEDVMLKTRFEVVREAIDVLFRRLERVPSSARTEELRAAVRDCMRRAGEEWSASPPPDRERDAIMKRVLELHIELTNLERPVPSDGRSRPLTLA
jgi:acyl-CoA reductase-like NAD-dependent aldehyde dehydrogenase